jgi:hypothetical protein
MKRRGLIPHLPVKHAACRVEAMLGAEDFHPRTPKA